MLMALMMALVMVQPSRIGLVTVILWRGKVVRLQLMVKLLSEWYCTICRMEVKMLLGRAKFGPWKASMKVSHTAPMPMSCMMLGILKL